MAKGCAKVMKDLADKGKNERLWGDGVPTLKRPFRRSASVLLVASRSVVLEPRSASPVREDALSNIQADHGAEQKQYRFQNRFQKQRQNQVQFKGRHREHKEQPKELR